MSAQEFQRKLKTGELITTKNGVQQGVIREFVPPSSELSKNGYYTELLLEKLRSGFSVFIPGEVYSSKNSKEIMYTYTKNSECCDVPFIGHGESRRCPKCKKPCQIKRIPFIGKSKEAKQYETSTIDSYKSHTAKFVKTSLSMHEPLLVGLFFVRRNHTLFDYNNMSQIVMDQIQAAGWLSNDSMKHVLPIFLGYIANKNDPGVVITLLQEELYLEAISNAICHA